MRSSGSMHAQVGTLIIATSGVQLANGFFGTFISLRVALEGFDTTLAGLVLSSFLQGLRSARCEADGLSSELATSAPMPPSQAWSSLRRRSRPHPVTTGQKGNHR